MTAPNAASVGPDFPALVAQARARMDVAERLAKAATEGPWTADGFDVYDQSKVGEVVAEAGLVPNDARHIAAWHPDVALRMVAWGRDVLDRHRALQYTPGRPDACPDCLGGISAQDPNKVRDCGCWGLSEPICGTCAQDGSAMRRYPQFWPCPDALAVLTAWGVTQ